MHPAVEDHYQTLGVDPTARVDEIKAAFRQAALRLHPDKETGSEDEFVKIQQAWAILSDPTSRAAYDRELAVYAARNIVHISDSIAACDMEPGRTDDGDCILSWPCRCGGAYVVLEEEMEHDGAEVAVQCSTCSLHIEVVPNTTDVDQ